MEKWDIGGEWDIGGGWDIGGRWDVGRIVWWLIGGIKYQNKNFNLPMVNILMVV